MFFRFLIRIIDTGKNAYERGPRAGMKVYLKE